MRLIAAVLGLCLLAGLGESASITYKSGLHRDLCGWGAQYWCSSPKTATLCGKTEWCTSNYWNRQVISEPTCSSAHNLIKHVRRVLASSDEKPTSEYEMAKILATGCSVIKEQDERQLCKEIVTHHEYLPRLVELIDAKLPVQSVAEAVGICKREAPKREVLETQPAPCITCEDVVTVTQKHASRHLSLDVYKKMFTSQCDKFGSGSKACHDAAIGKYKDFYRRFAGVNPSSVCKAEKQCISKSGRLSPIASESEVCATCETVIKDIRSMDRDAKVEDAIRGLVNETCKYMGEFEKLCKVMVDEGLEYVFEIIATELEPEAVCQKLHLCSGDGMKTKVKPVATEKASLSGPKCALCEFMMKEVDKTLLSNKTEEAILKVLDQVCSRLPPSIAQECEALLNQYKPEIVKLLSKELAPENVCTFLGICTKNAHQGEPKETIKQDSDGELCELCKYLVDYIDQYLEKNSTEQQIEQALEQVCNFLPASVKQQCDGFVTQYTPQLIQLLLQLKPEQVCTYLGLCSSKGKMTAGPTCILCEFVMTQLDSILASNATQQQIVQALDQVCNFLPASVKQQCDGFVKQYTPTLIQLLLQVKPSQVCTSLKLCNSSNEGLKVQEQVKDTVQCTLCKFVMNQLEKMLGDNATEPQIEKALDQVCNFLPASVKAECDSFLKQYTPQLIQLLLQIKPNQICSFIKLCTNTVKGILYPLYQLTPDGPQCALCEFVLTQLDSMLTKNATQAQIEAALDQVCNFLPASIKQECDTLVQQYTPQLIQLLLQFKPQEVCTRLGLCTSKTSGQIIKANDGPQCTLCEFVLTQLDNILADNSTQAQIEAALDQVCNFLPASIKQECDTLVQQYTPQLVQLLLQFKPQEVCTRLGLCTSKTTVQIIKANDGPQCTLCEFVLTQLDNILADNSTQAQIEAALDQVCNFLPASIKQECDTLVQQYTPQLIQLLLQFKPQEVCTRLGLCTSKNSGQILKVNNGSQCILCEFALTQLDNMLAENSTQAQIEAALDQVCNFLPASIKQECDTLVQQYTPQLIQLLLQFKPQEVCTRLGLCTSKTSVNNGSQCILCEFALTQLDNMLAENSTQAQIEAALDQVCNFLPASIKQECDTLVQQYTPQLVQLLLQFKPQEVCTRLGLCTSKHSGQTLNVNDGPQCTLCEFVLTQLDNMLADNSTQTQIEAALDQVCNFLPASIKQECDTLVQQYTPQLIQLLLQFKPQEVCTRLGLCTSKTSVNNGSQCILCEFALTQLDKMLAENSTQAQIEAALDQVCNFLPASIKQECDSLVQQYTPQLIQLLLQFKPQEVCTRLGLCTSKTPGQTLKVNDGPQCTLCEFVLTQLDNILADNSTQTQIEAALDQVCNFLPASIKQECDTLVQQYTPQLIQLLLQFKPQEVCTRLGLCTSKHSVNDGPQCILCEFVLTQLDNMLANNSTQAQIEAALDQVCNFLPASIKQECDTLVQQYTPQLIQLLLQFKPQEVCTRLGLCTS
ncbi:hypothetical protein EGW08_003711, partial [Elysia chlorotica]